MMRSVFWALVRKDLYLLRAMSIAGVVIGVASLFLMLTSKVGYAVGGVLYLTANMASALMLAMAGLFGERKEQARLFALCLPISGQRFDLAKLTALNLAYAIPWLVMTAVALAVTTLSRIVPAGYLVYTIILQGSFFALFSVFITGLFVALSEQFGGLLILPVNILFTLFIIALNQPAVVGPLSGPHVVWTAFAVRSLIAEIVMTLLSLTVAVIVITRRRDHL